MEMVDREYVVDPHSDFTQRGVTQSDIDQREAGR